MKRNVCLTLTVVGLLCGVGLVFTIGAQTSTEKHVFTPDAIPYGPAPAFLHAGAQLAVLEGNPGASSGDYTVRLKMPDGYRIRTALASLSGERDCHLRDFQGWDGR